MIAYTYTFAGVVFCCMKTEKGNFIGKGRTNWEAISNAFKIAL